MSGEQRDSDKAYRLLFEVNVIDSTHEDDSRDNDEAR
jgi:hypothetical protein